MIVIAKTLSLKWGLLRIIIFNYITIGKRPSSKLSLHVGGDPLNNIQSNFGIEAPGNSIYLYTNSYKLSHSIDWFQKLNLPNYE